MSFKKWCDNNNCHNDGWFTVTNENNNCFHKGESVRLKKEKNGISHVFENADGRYCFVNVNNISPSCENNTDDFPKLPFRVSNARCKLTRQFLKDNNCVWDDGSDIMDNHTQWSRMFVDCDRKVYSHELWLKERCRTIAYNDGLWEYID